MKLSHANSGFIYSELIWFLKYCFVVCMSLKEMLILDSKTKMKDFITYFLFCLTLLKLMVGLALVPVTFHCETLLKWLHFFRLQSPHLHNKVIGLS
jgi:hypothetical protein